MHFIVALDDSIYQLWQAEVLLYHFQKLGLQQQLWLSILYDGQTPPSLAAQRIQQRHSNTRIYANDFPHPWHQYKPICKPFGCAKLLEEHPELGQCCFLMDSDIMLAKPISFTAKMLNNDCIYGSDTASYLSFHHFHHDRNVSLEHMQKLCDIVGPDLLSSYRKAHVIGAQYLFKNVDAAFFHKVSTDAWHLHQYALQIQQEGNKCQTWVMGEMLSMLLNCIQRVGLRKVKTCRALDFGWGTDPYSDFDEKKHAIFHMAGITRESGQFDKQRYVAFSPWDPQAKDMSYITDKTTCAQKWRELVEEYSRQMM